MNIEKYYKETFNAPFDTNFHDLEDWQIKYIRNSPGFAFWQVEQAYCAFKLAFIDACNDLLNELKRLLKR